jgi:hypothetical protein
MMSSYTVTFIRDEFLPATRMAVDYQIYYSYVPTEFVNQPEQEFHTKYAGLHIGITSTLIRVWGINDRGDERKILFEHAKRYLKQKAEEKTLGVDSGIELTTYNSPEVCPFNPERIKLLFDTPFELEVPEENAMTITEPSAIPSQIIDLRDSINALFGEKHKGRLLSLPQERHLVELFKQCKDHESFAYRVASLGGLATAFNVDYLRKHVLNEKQTLGILGTFLREHYSDAQVNPIMDTLSNFNRLRRMYPIHSDRTDGVLEAHRFFGLDYPVRDHGKAGQVLLEGYRDCLGQILALFKKENG